MSILCKIYMNVSSLLDHINIFYAPVNVSSQGGIVGIPWDSDDLWTIQESLTEPLFTRVG